jgi:hypothetical protein
VLMKGRAAIRGRYGRRFTNTPEPHGAPRHPNPEDTVPTVPRATPSPTGRKGTRHATDAVTREGDPPVAVDGSADPP